MPNSLQIDLQLNIDNARRQLNQLNQDAQKAFKSGGTSSASYQQAAQAAAQQRVQYRDAISQQSVFNKAIAEETKLRQQAMQATKQHGEEMRRQYSPAGQTLAGAVPGGNILGSGLSGGGMAALAGATVVAAAVAAVGNEFNKLGDRARELAASSGTASSQLGQLRSSIEKAGISRDIAATSPGVVGFQKFVSDIGTNIDDAFAHLSSPADRSKALQEKLAGGLGQGNEDWRRLKEQGTDLEQDIGIARTAMQVKWQRQERDFAQTRKEFEVSVGNQRFDLQKEASRQQFDQTIAIQKFQENFANNQATKAYNLSRQFAAQSFQISQGRATQDFAIGQGDKAFDFKKSIGDQNQDFAISQSRAMTSRKNQLFDMAMGGANGLQYLQASRDFNQQQQYAKQDLALNQSRETRDYGIGVGRDTRNFGISQGRAIQDFAQQSKEAAASRQLELESQEYARKYEGIELQTQINRQSQDLAINFQRLNQQIGFQQTRLNNQASDQAYDKNLDYSNFALQTGRQRRNFGYAEADFAGSARDKDPLGAAGLGSRDAAFAEALAANARQSGQTDLFKQVNDASNKSNNSLGAQAGDVIGRGGEANAKSIIDGFGALFNDLRLLMEINYNKANSSSGGSSAPVVPIGGNTYNFPAGLDPGLTGQIQTIVDEGDKKTQEQILELIRRVYGG